jgi:hypothetical protein
MPGRDLSTERQSLERPGALLTSTSNTMNSTTGNGCRTLFITVWALLFGGGGAAAAWHGNRLLHEATSLEARGIVVPASVTRAYAHKGDWTVRYAYLTPRGSFESQNVLHGDRRFREGQKIQALYLPEDPQVSSLDLAAQRSQGHIALSMGSIFVAIAVAVWLAFARSPNGRVRPPDLVPPESHRTL